MIVRCVVFHYSGPVVQFSILCSIPDFQFFVLSIPDSQFSIPIFNFLFLRFSILHFRFPFSILYFVFCNVFCILDSVLYSIFCSRRGPKVGVVCGSKSTVGVVCACACVFSGRVKAEISRQHFQSWRPFHLILARLKCCMESAGGKKYTMNYKGTNQRPRGPRYEIVTSAGFFLQNSSVELPSLPRLTRDGLIAI